MNDAKRMYKILWPISKTETDSGTFYMGTGKGYVGLGNRKLWEWEDSGNRHRYKHMNSETNTYVHVLRVHIHTYR